MSKIRTFVALACVSGAVLLGAAAPAQAAAPVSHSAAQIASVPSPYHFGTYYTRDACEYFGNSLVSAGVWNWYRCSYEADPYTGVYYWNLTMFT